MPDRVAHRLPALVLFGLLGASTAFAAVAPLGPELGVNVRTAGGQAQPSVATGADGRVLMVWGSFGGGDTLNGVVGRLYDAGSGSFLSDEILIAAVASVRSTKVVAEPGGGYFVAWVDGLETIHARRCGADGRPAGAAFLASVDIAGPGTFDMAAIPSGGHVVISAAESQLPPFQSSIAVDVLDASDSLVPAGRHIIWPGQNGAFAVQPRIAAMPGGGFVLAWQNAFAPFNDVWAERLSPLGAPLDEPFRVNDLSTAARSRPSVIAENAEEGGGFAVVWRNLTNVESLNGLWVQRYDAAGARRGAAIHLADVSHLSPTSDIGLAPEAVAGPAGSHLLLWPDHTPHGELLLLGRVADASWQPAGDVFQVNVAPLSFMAEVAASFVPGGGFVALWPRGFTDDNPSDVFSRRFSADCRGGAGSLCLNGDRFFASVAWHDPRSGARGTATALPLTTDTGAFWFFSAGNAELLVKVLDGRPVNGSWWVFFGALTDLEYDLTVTDAETGIHKVYHNPPYTLASRADVNAFPEPPPGSSSDAPVEGVATRGLPRSNTACPAGACLGPFQVRVEWIDPATGQTRQAAGMPLSDGSAYFWFFDPSNIELIVKVIDGHAVNGHWWVFYGALSNVEYTIHVDRPDQGLSRSYHNAAGHMESRADTLAFP
jgi:hypothetical protein